MRSKLTYSNVVSTLCLFLLLGGAGALAAAKLGKNTVGTKQLKNNAVTSPKVKQGSLTGADINVSTLGTVPNAANAATASNANELGGSPASQFLTIGQPPSAWENVTLGTNWGNPAFFLANAQCYLDALGVVHLRGEARVTGVVSTHPITLPADCAPAYNIEVVGAVVDTGPAGTGPALLSIQTDGLVILDSPPPPGVGSGIVFDGISFRKST
jgi:hypothetical protein